MNRIELYTYEAELWYRTAEGANGKLTELSREVIRPLLETIQSFYPKAYKALDAEYARLASNAQFKQFRIVNRFCKCNFGNIDNVYDVDGSGRFNFEHVSCPLRGECRLEKIVCMPEFDCKISEAEMRVLKLIYQGLEKEVIAEQLYLSLHTVNNHIRNAYSRLGLHEKAEFIDYAHRNKLFPTE